MPDPQTSDSPRFTPSKSSQFTPANSSRFSPAGLSGSAKTAWDWLNTGLIPLGKLSKDVADRIQKNADQLGNHASVVSGPEGAYLKLSSRMGSFIAGTLQGAGKVAESFTSPVNAILWASGAGEAKAAAMGAKELAAGLRTLRLASGLGFGAQGAGQIAQGVKDRSLEETALGVAQTAFGAVGLGQGAAEVAPRPDTVPTAIPKPRPVAEPSARPSARVAPISLEPLSTPAGQRKIGPLPPGQSGVPETPATSPVRGGRNAAGQRSLQTLSPETSGAPNAPEGRTFGLRGRQPGEPVTEVQGPHGPTVIRPTSKSAPFQRSLPELPPEERGRLEEARPLRSTAEALPKKGGPRFTKAGTPRLTGMEASPEAKIPASWMPHFEELVTDAKQQGFTGTRQELAGRFVERLNQALAASDQMRELAVSSGTGTDLLQTIARAGGFGIERETAMKGELEDLRQSTVRGPQQRAKGKFLPGLVKVKGGQPIDRILEAVNEEPQFAGKFGHFSELLDAVRDAVETQTGQRRVPGTDVHEIMDRVFQVKAGSRWWDDGGQAENISSPDAIHTSIVSKLKAAGVPDSHLIDLDQDISGTAALLQHQLSHPEDAADLQSAIDEYVAIRTEQYYGQENMPDMMAGPADILSTGEAQPRLPGPVGEVRDQEVAQPKLAEEKREFNKKLDMRHELQDELFPGEKTELFGGLGAIDVKAIPANVLEWVEGLRSETRGFFAATKITDEATRTAYALDQTFADLQNEEDIRRAAAVKTFHAWQGVPDDLSIKAISEYERTGRFPIALDPDGSYAQTYRESMQLAHGWLREGFGNDTLSEIENYVRHAFDLKPKDVETATRALETAYRRTSLSANRSVTRQRALKMPLDEAIKALEQKGIKATLRESNPEKLRQWAVNNAYRALRFTQLGDYLRDSGLVKFVRDRSTVPNGWVALKDPVFKRFFRVKEGFVQASQGYADPNVARILDRAVSLGIQGRWYQTMRGSNIIWNQLNLGLSFFHAMESGVNAGASELARAVQAAMHREIGRAALSTAKGVGSVMTAGISSTLEQGLKGRAFKKAVMNGDPAMTNVLNEVFNPAGARLLLEKQYLTHHWDVFKDAWANSQPVKAGFNLLASVPQWLAKPLMEKAIPNIKIGAFLDLATDIQRRMPNASFAERQKAYRLAWDAMDDRFGLLTHDNLHWSRTASDLSQLAIRSVGWSFGTVRSFGGSALDLINGLNDLTAGRTESAKRNLTSERIAFTLALPTYVALTGIWYQYLRTGRYPTSKKDLFFPQNGGLTPNGDPDRVQMKSYISDIISYSRDPLTAASHKISPELEAVVSLATNRNFFGDLVRNPDDPASTQAYQIGEFLVQSFQPFSFQQFSGARKESLPLGASVERGLGIQKAPAWATQTPFENEVVKKERHRLGERHRTPEEVTTDHAKQEAALAYKQATTAGERQTILSNLIRQGVINSPSQMLAFKRRVETPIAEIWQTLPMADRLELLKKYPKDVRKLLGGGQ